MSNRWRAEISYNNGDEQETVEFEELHQLHDIVEMGPDWNTIDKIVVVLTTTDKPAAVTAATEQPQ